MQGPGAQLLVVAAGLGMARSEPGVWSALSFLGGQTGAGKRSTDEFQELYPDPIEEDDMDTAGSYQDLAFDYEEYDEQEPRVQPYRRRRKPYRRRRKNTPPPQHSAYWDSEQEKGGNYVDIDSRPLASSAYDGPSAYDSSSYGASPAYDSSNYDLTSDYEDRSSYEAPSSNYESPSYPAGPSAPSYDTRPQDSFNDFLNALAAFLPIGLFLAAIPPNLIVINSTSRRKRQAEDSILNSVSPGPSVSHSPGTHRPFLEKMVTLGTDVWSPQCQAQLFCQMAELGGTPEGNSIQRIFSAATQLTPDFAANMLGVRDVFQASRQGRCSDFQCDH